MQPHPDLGAPSYPFQLQEPKGLESLSNHLASHREGRKLLPEGFLSFLHPPQAASATGDLAQTPGPHTAVDGHEGEGKKSPPAGLHPPQSLIRGAYCQSHLHCTTCLVEDVILYRLD